MRDINITGQLPPGIEALIKDIVIEIGGHRIPLVAPSRPDLRSEDAADVVITLNTMLLNSGFFTDSERLQWSKDPVDIGIKISALLGWYSMLREKYDMMREAMQKITGVLNRQKVFIVQIPNPHRDEEDSPHRYEYQVYLGDQFIVWKPELKVVEGIAKNLCQAVGGVPHHIEARHEAEGQEMIQKVLS